MILWVVSIWMLWTTCGIIFATYVFDTKNISRVNEISPNIFKRGLILLMMGPAFILAILALWIENKLSLPIRRFINWLLD